MGSLSINTWLEDLELGRDAMNGSRHRNFVTHVRRCQLFYELRLFTVTRMGIPMLLRGSTTAFTYRPTQRSDAKEGDVHFRTTAVIRG